MMFKNNKSNLINHSILLILFLFTFLNIASVGLPILIDIILLTIVIFTLRKNRVILLNINIFFLLFIGASTIIFKHEDKRHYYRGHEKFYENRLSYKKNINETILMKHGELPVLDVCNNSKTIIRSQIRKQVFITDNYGYRNSEIDIKKADLIIVGDSLISGGSASDEDILSYQLNKFSNYKTANLAMGGINPKDYEEILKKYLPILKNNVKIFVFYYEGNDFEIYNKNEIPKYSYKDFKINKYKFKIRFGYERLERNKDKLFIKNLNYENFFYKKIRPKSQRLFKRAMSKWTNTCDVQYDFIDNKLTGFLWANRNKEYIYKTHIINNPEILKRINKVFFVPTKSTVYKKYTKNLINYDSNKFLFLQKSYSKKNIDVVDLTLPFKSNIKKYFLKKNLLFFKDDTHLNKYGISVLADYILDQSL